MNFIDTKLNPWATLSLVVATCILANFWKCMSQASFIKRFKHPQTLIKDDKIQGKRTCLQSSALIFYICQDLLNKRNLARSCWSWRTIVALVILNVSNEPIVSYLGSQFFEIRFTNIANTLVLLCSSKDRGHTWPTHKWLMWVTHTPPKFSTLMQVKLH
jgi:hypothetical protein